MYPCQSKSLSFSFSLLDTHLPISLKSNPPSNPANFATSAINIFASYSKKSVTSTTSLSSFMSTYWWMNIHKESRLDVFASKSTKMHLIKAWIFISFHSTQKSISTDTYTTELGCEILHKRIYKAHTVRARLIRQSRLRALDSAIALRCRALKTLES